MKYIKIFLLSTVLYIGVLYAGQQAIQQNDSALQDPIASYIIQAMQDCINFNEDVNWKLLGVSNAKSYGNNIIDNQGSWEKAVGLFHKYINELRQKYNDITRPELTILPEISKNADLQTRLVVQANQAQFLFTRLLDEYIAHLGQVYDKKSGLLGLYRTSYYISSRNNRSLSITPNEYTLLLQTLENAAQQKDWAKSVDLKVLVIQENGSILEKTLNLDEIINAMKQVPLPVQYSTAAKIGAGVVAAAAIGTGAYLAYQAYNTQPAHASELEKEVTAIKSQIDALPIIDKTTAAPLKNIKNPQAHNSSGIPSLPQKQSLENPVITTDRQADLIASLQSTAENSTIEKQRDTVPASADLKKEKVRRSGLQRYLEDVASNHDFDNPMAPNTYVRSDEVDTYLASLPIHAAADLLYLPSDVANRAKITYENVSNDTYKPGQTAQRLIEKSIQTTEDYAHGNSDSSLEDPILQPFDSGDQALIHTTNALWLGSGLLHAANNKILNAAGNKITGETAQGVDQGFTNFANYGKGHPAPAPKADTPALTPPAPAPSPQQAPTLTPKPLQVPAPSAQATPAPKSIQPQTNRDILSQVNINHQDVLSRVEQQLTHPDVQKVYQTLSKAEQDSFKKELERTAIETEKIRVYQKDFEGKPLKIGGASNIEQQPIMSASQANKPSMLDFIGEKLFGKATPTPQPNIDAPEIAQAAQNALKQLEIKTLKAQQDKEFLTAFNKLSDAEKANFSTADADKIFNKNKNMIEINKRLEEVLDPTRVYTAPTAPAPKQLPHGVSNVKQEIITAPAPAIETQPRNLAAEYAEYQKNEAAAAQRFVELANKKTPTQSQPQSADVTPQINNVFNNLKNSIKSEYDKAKTTANNWLDKASDTMMGETAQGIDQGIANLGNYGKGSVTQEATPVLKAITPFKNEQKALTVVTEQPNAIVPFNAQTKALAPSNNQTTSITRFNPEQKAIAPFVEQPKGITPFNEQTRAIAPVVAEQKSITPFKIAETDIVPILTKENAVIPFKLEQKDILPAIAKENAITPYKSEQKDIIPFVEQQKNLATKLSQDVKILEQELAKTLPAIRSNAAPVAKPVQASTQQIPLERSSRLEAKYPYLPEGYIEPYVVQPIEKNISPTWAENLRYLL
ncbi:MAG: hypothetical protein Q8Q60_05320 [Candidatus Chromulinivorax sp.]|nr:hypothetical protein [Candidatus Chromulinivorax sp.]